MTKNNKISPKYLLIIGIVLTVVLSLAVISVYAFYGIVFETDVQEYTLTLDDFRFKLNGSPIDATCTENITLDKGDTASFKAELSVYTSEKINNSYVFYTLAVSTVCKDGMGNTLSTALSDALKKGLFVHIRENDEETFVGSLYDVENALSGANVVTTGSLYCDEMRELYIDIQNSTVNTELFESVNLAITINALPELRSGANTEIFYCLSSSDLTHALNNSVDYQNKKIALAEDIIVPTAVTGATLTAKALDLNGHTLSFHEPSSIIFSGGENGYFRIYDSKKKAAAGTVIANLTASSDNNLAILSEYSFTVSSYSVATLASAMEKLISFEMYTSATTLDLNTLLFPYKNAVTAALFKDTTNTEISASLTDAYVFSLTNTESLSRNTAYTLYLTQGENTSNASFSVLFRGSELFDVANYYIGTLPNYITSSLYMPGYDTFTGATLRWETDKPAVLADTGLLTADFTQAASWFAERVKVGLYVGISGKEYYQSKTLTLTLSGEKRIDYVLPSAEISIENTGVFDILDYVDTDFSGTGLTNSLGYTNIAVTALTINPVYESYLDYSDLSSINILNRPNNTASIPFTLAVSFTFADGVVATRNVPCYICNIHAEQNVVDIGSQIRLNISQSFNSLTNTNDEGTRNLVRSYTDEGKLVSFVNNYYPTTVNEATTYGAIPFIEIKNGSWEAFSPTEYALNQELSVEYSDLYVSYTLGGESHYAQIVVSALYDQDGLLLTNSEGLYTFGSLLSATQVEIAGVKYPIAKNASDKTLIYELSDGIYTATTPDVFAGNIEITAEDSNLFVIYNEEGTLYYKQLIRSKLLNNTTELYNANNTYTFSGLTQANKVQIGEVSYNCNTANNALVLYLRHDAEIVMKHADPTYPVTTTSIVIGVQLYDLNVTNPTLSTNYFTDNNNERTDTLFVTLPVTGIIKEGIDVLDSLLYHKLYDIYDTNSDGLLTFDEANPVNDEGKRTLRAENCKIESLDGLNYFGKLKSIYLSNNQIEDIHILAELEGLTDLDLSGNRITDITNLSELHRLITLNLANNNVSDLSPLRYLLKLTTLNLDGNTAITDYSVFEQLPELSSVIPATTAHLNDYYVFLCNGSDDADIQAVINIINNVMSISEYRKVLYLPTAYGAYTLKWEEDGALINIAQDGSYTLNSAIIDTPVTLRLSVSSGSGDNIITLTRTLKLTCLKASDTQDVYVEQADGNILLSSAFPDYILQSVIYNTVSKMPSHTNPYLISLSELAAITSLSGLSGVESIYGLSLLTGLTTLDLSDSSIEDDDLLDNDNNLLIPETINTLYLTGHRYDFSKLLRGTNWLDRLYVGGCYDLTDSEVLDGLFKVYIENDNPDDANDHVSIYLTGTVEEWNPFADYNLRYSDSILSYITLQVIGNKSLYEADNGALSLHAVKGSDNYYYYRFNYYANDNDPLNYYVKAFSDIKQIKGDTLTDDKGNNIGTYVIAVASDTAHSTHYENINYKSLSPSSQVLYIKALFTSAEIVHGANVTFEKVIQLKFEYNEELKIRIITKEGTGYSYVDRPLEETFPGEDIRAYVLRAFTSNKGSGNPINGTYYIYDGLSAEDIAEIADVSSPYHSLITGSDVFSFSTYVNSATDSVEVFSKYIYNSENEATALTGLKYIPMITDLEIFRDATLKTGDELVNLTSLGVGYSGLDLSKIEASNVQNITSFINYVNSNFSVNFYDTSTVMHVANDITFSLAGNKVTVVFGATTPYVYFDRSSAVVQNYNSVLLSDVFKGTDNRSYLRSIYIAEEFFRTEATKNLNATEIAELKSELSEFFYLLKFDSLSITDFHDCGIDDYIFLLPLTNSKLNTITEMNFTSVTVERNNTNQDCTYSSILFKNLKYTTLVGGVSTEEKTTLQGVNISYYDFPALLGLATEKPTVTLSDLILPAYDYTGAIPVLRTGYNDSQYAYANDSITLPNDVATTKLIINGEELDITSLQWALKGSGNQYYFNALFTGGINCASVSSDNIAEALASNGSGVLEDIATSTITLTFKYFPYDTYFFFEAFVTDEDEVSYNIRYPILLIHDNAHDTIATTNTASTANYRISSGNYVSAADYNFTASGTNATNPSNLKLFKWICVADNIGYSESQRYTGTNHRGGVYASYASFSDKVLRFTVYQLMQNNACNRGNLTNNTLKGNASMAAPGAFLAMADGEVNYNVIALNGNSNGYALPIQMIENIEFNLGNSYTMFVIVNSINKYNYNSSYLYSYWLDENGALITGNANGQMTSSFTHSYGIDLGATMLSTQINSFDGMEIFCGLSLRNNGTSGLKVICPVGTTKTYSFSASRQGQIYDSGQYKLVLHTSSYTYTLSGGVPTYKLSTTEKRICTTPVASVNFTQSNTGVALPANFTAATPNKVFDFYLELPSNHRYLPADVNKRIAADRNGYYLVSAFDLFTSPNFIYTVGMRTVTANNVIYSKVLGLSTSTENGTGGYSKTDQEHGIPFSTSSDNLIYISYENVLLVNKFFDPAYGITSLEGIDVFENLEYITMIKNNISDISPLKNLHLKSFRYSNSGPCNVNKFQITDWSPLMAGSKNSLLVFDYAFTTSGYDPDTSNNIIVYVDDFTFLMDFKNLQSISIGFTDAPAAVCLDMPSAKYVFNTMMDRSIYPSLDRIIVFGEALRTTDENEISTDSFDLEFHRILRNSNSVLVYQYDDEINIVNSNYNYAKTVLSQLKPFDEAKKTDNQIVLKKSDYTLGSGWSFSLQSKLTYLGVDYLIEWQSLSPNITVSVDAINANGILVIDDGHINSAPVAESDLFNDEYDYTYDITVKETNQPITTYIIAKVQINGSIYVRPFYVNLHNGSMD